MSRRICNGTSERLEIRAWKTMYIGIESLVPGTSSKIMEAEPEAQLL